jgi:AbrB family transcriptional regulator, transcriptional pleiotropic regulator of transition state genes
MKATGVIRKIDDLGRIVIPKELRDVRDISVGTQMEFFTDNDGNIIVRKYSPNNGCSECGEIGVRLVGKSKICRSCASNLANELEV